MTRSLFVHVVTFNSASVIAACLESVIAQLGFDKLVVSVTDNASSDSSADIVQRKFCEQVKAAVLLRRNAANLGFCGAHNQGALDFLASDCDYFCILNPDVRLEPDCLSSLVGACQADQRLGLATPLLLRADEHLNPLHPEMVDAAGMQLFDSLRHFDRGSGQPLTPEYLEERDIFGGTGACLIIKRECLQDLLLESGSYDDALYKIYPQLKDGREQRAALFDEAFFAYREDADLCWRANLLKWRCRFVPAARAYHQRVVTPERRALLPALINSYGVRNRFLLQLNNYSFDMGWRRFVFGFVVRNLIVLLGVLLRERTSLGALVQFWQLAPRAMKRRKVLFRKISKIGSMA
ncbi:MAG: glycosyltransferase family 2 protein [Oligoflexia bacterium]|nr:glycosyltransferase family 2 protein [Oligoflexia bacterium]